MMGVEPQSLRERHVDAERQRRKLEHIPSLNSAAFEACLEDTINKFEDCVKIASNVSLFSFNETLEDVATSDLQYLLLHFHLAELASQIKSGDRKESLHRSRANYDRFLGLIDSYRLLSDQDTKLYERYQEHPHSFSIVSTVDSATRRASKIARFKEEKALKIKLEHLEGLSDMLANDETSLRDLHLTHIRLCIHQTFQALESIAQEFEILKMAPITSVKDSSLPDSRSRSRDSSNHVDRLDINSSGLRGNGPILSPGGRPLRPFTLLDKRQTLQKGVFRPDHNLPTMTIDEYLEEERRRGGIIQGGGPESAKGPEVNEDDDREVDQETLKHRRWDDWKDENPKGAGNTLNRG